MAGLYRTHRSGPDTTEPIVMARQPLPVTTMDQSLWHSADPFKQKSERQVLGKYSSFKTHNESSLFLPLAITSPSAQLWVVSHWVSVRMTQEKGWSLDCQHCRRAGLPHSGWPCPRTSLYRKGKFLLSIYINFLLVTAKSIPVHRQLK